MPPRFVSFEGGDVCSFVGSLILSFVPSFLRSSERSSVRPFVRAFIRPSARWYWPCNWAQTLSSARPAKDYTPACPEGLEPNVLVWYIMLQIPVSDSRGEAGVNGVTFSVLKARFYTIALAISTSSGCTPRPILDQTSNARRVRRFVWMAQSRYPLSLVSLDLVRERAPARTGPEIQTSDLSITPSVRSLVRSILLGTDSSEFANNTAKTDDGSGWPDTHKLRSLRPDCDVTKLYSPR